MGRRDLETRQLLDHADVFADIINVLLFNGEAAIPAGELRMSTTRTVYKADSGAVRDQERDVSKIWDAGGTSLALFGFENQSDSDGRMPIRVIGYDGASYRNQIRRSDGPGRFAHGEEQGFFPVVTLVLYYGGGRWAGPRSLNETLAIPAVLAPYVPDYRIHVFEIAYLQDEVIRKFQSDFRTVAELFKQNRLLKERRITRISLSRRKLEHAAETLGLLKAVARDDRFEELFNEMEQKGEARMFEAFDIMKEMGKNEGLTAGRTEGVRVLVRSLKRFLTGEEAVCEAVHRNREYSDISAEEIKKIYGEE